MFSVLSAVAAVNLAVEKSNAQETFKQMLRPECCISNLDEECKEKYQEALAQQRAHKLKVSLASPRKNIITEIIIHACYYHT